ncbi:MAG: phosphoglucomutase/phosphomannomutase family protein [Ardenticatenaceae bacterium]|nr:phosphoglucomutase/phosphomannomutase family protein [Ardenticatenaceae bacterium]
MDEVIKFGTDGWRGVIAEDYTFDNVRRVAQAYAAYLKEIGDAGKGIVIGYDYRFASEYFAATTAEVMAGNGIHVYLTAGPMPTPVISFATLWMQAGGAVNITASHNPPTDNGFKIRASYGGAVASEKLKDVEKHLPQDQSGVRRLPHEQAEAQGLLEYIDPTEAYVEQLKRLVNIERIRGAGLKVVHDAMWGVGAGWFPRILGPDSRTIIHEIHNVRNPIFPEMERPEPIPPNTAVCQATVPEVGAAVGILTDGDADRIGIVADNGDFVNQLQVYALLAYYLLEVQGERGAIVKTLSTTSMLEKLGQLYGVPVYETGVGFKYVAPKMIETEAMIGGEESGGYAFRGHVPERDGLLAGLMFLDLMVQTGRTPTQLIEDLYARVGRHYYDRVDVPYPPEQRDEILERVRAARPKTLAGFPVERIDTTDGWKYYLGNDGGWLLIRFSGTEPVMRVYTETLDPGNVEKILQAGLKLAGVE